MTHRLQAKLTSTSKDWRNRNMMDVEVRARRCPAALLASETMLERPWGVTVQQTAVAEPMTKTSDTRDICQDKELRGDARTAS